MESQEDEDYSLIINDAVNMKEKTTIVVISSINNSISLNLKSELKNIENTSEELIEESTLNLSKSEDLIYDVNNLTRKLNTDQINSLSNELQKSKSNNEIRYNFADLSEVSNSGNENNQVSEEDKLDQEFGQRTKNQKLSHEQLNIIKMELDSQLLTTKQLCNKFNVSASLISKIKRMNNFEVVRGPVRNIIKLNILQKKILAKEINHIIKNNNYAIDCKDITVSTNNLLGTNYPVYFIRSFMKNELNYSYKRVKSRPNQIDMKRLRSIRFLYAVKFNQTITSKNINH